MIKSFVLMLVVLFSVAVLAQQDPQMRSNPNPQAGSKPSDRTESAQVIQGCLQGSGDNYTITDASGTKYQLQGDTSKLTEHVGHEVQVTGAVNTTATSSSSSSPSGSTSSASQQVTIQVQDVKHVASSCKTGSQ